MDAQRKDTIINEIKYWKESHLLPGKYCDFLLALYTEGEDEHDETASNLQRKNLLTSIYGFINLLIVPTMAFIIYSTNLATVYSIILLVLSFIICLGISYIGANVFSIDSKFISLALSLNVLLISLIVVNQWVAQPFIGLTVVFIQLILWIGLGIKFSNKWLIIMGSLGLIVSIVMLSI